MANITHLSHSKRKAGPWLVVLLSAVIVTPALAQSESFRPQFVEPLTESWRVRAFDQLKGQGLECIGEDAERNMLFGTDQGVAVYDGYRWQFYDASAGVPGKVTSIARVGERTFVATHHAVHLLDDGRFTQVFPPTDWGKGKRNVYHITAGRDDSLWVATGCGAVRLRGLERSGDRFQWKDMTVVTTEQFRRSLFNDWPADKLVNVETPNTEKWKTGVGIVVDGDQNQGNIVIAVAEDGPASRAGIQPGDRIVAIDGEHRSTVLQHELEAEEGALIKLSIQHPVSGQTLQVDLVCESLDGPRETFRPAKIIEGEDGIVWFATIAGSIISYQEGGEESWRNHSQEAKLASVLVPSITVTPDGVAAVGRNTANGALLMFDGEMWTTIELSRRIGSSILARDDGTILVGTNGAVLVVSRDGRVADYGFREFGIYGNDALLFNSSDGALWVAGRGSVAMRVEPQGKAWTSFKGLSFQDIGTDGSEWFVTHQLRVVSHRDGQWTPYDQSDGLMSAPFRIIVTSGGEVWAAGSHHGVAATATLVGDRWETELHPDVAWSIDRRAVFEDRQGRLWFGAAVTPQLDTDMKGGVIRWDGREWKHFQATNRLEFVYGFGQTADGSVWCAGPTLVQILPDDTLSKMPPSNPFGFCDSVMNDRDGNLWVGTRNYGVQRVASQPPFQRSVFDESIGLSNNRIRSLVPLGDRVVLAATPAGFDRFDGNSWSPAAVPKQLAFSADYGGLRKGRAGELWVNSRGLGLVQRDLARSADFDTSGLGEEFLCYRYTFDRAPPHTIIESTTKTAVFGDEIAVLWTGGDEYDRTPPEDLRYSWRIGQQSWSPFEERDRLVVKGVSAGSHQLQVRARDADGNVELSPAEITLEILPAIWQRGWFRWLSGLLLALSIAAVAQTIRVVQRDASLRATNQKLMSAEEELRRANQGLEQRVSERTTQLELANQQLQESEIKYRSVVEDQTEYIVRFDAGGEITFINGALKRAVGTTESSQQTNVTLPEDWESRAKRTIAGLSARNQRSHEIVRYTDEHGETQWEEWQSRAIIDESGELLGYQTVGTNITKLRRTQDRLEEREKQLAHLARVSALGEMVAGISHELNQPLAAIGNFATASRMVLDKRERVDDDCQKVKQWIEKIQSQTERINDIILGLHRFGQPGTAMDRFAIKAAIAESLELCESRTRAFVDEIVVQCPDDLPEVCADRVQIEQVLVNLIRNACDAMDAEEGNRRRLTIQTTFRDSRLFVAVKDSGQGIEADRLEEVFESFVTTKSDGMGIGLAISRSIIESHGGKMYALANKGGGHFEFSLPVAS